QKDPDPLKRVEDHRMLQKQEDEEFGNYVEELLSRPFLKPEIQNHGVQWLKSKIKIDEFKRREAQATQTIAEYAFQVFSADPLKKEFTLSGPSAKVKVRI